ncbi:MAG: nucleotidyl transferase AbiEii/AbiGii toxin family protein [Anaerolineae bacterium]|nr:nucleotidyl transferase AbiEii/AbiGii toxin family protein [Anaerolineae bacterium]
MASLTAPHWHCVRPILRDLLLEIGQQPFAQRFYLAGGTGLALQIGHRMSNDLDFFSSEDDLDEGSRAEIVTALEQRFSLDVNPARWFSQPSYWGGWQFCRVYELWVSAIVTNGYGRRGSVG